MDFFNQHRTNFLSSLQQSLESFEQEVRSYCAARQFQDSSLRSFHTDDAAGETVAVERESALQAKVLVLDGKLSLVDDLRRENERLRHALGHQDLAVDPEIKKSDASHRNSSADGQICYQDFVDLSQKYISLQTRHDLQKRQVRMYNGALKKLKEKCKKYEADLRHWASFWDRKHLAIQRQGGEIEPRTPAPLAAHTSAATSDLITPITGNVHNLGSPLRLIAEDLAPEAEPASKLTLNGPHSQDEHSLRGVLSPHTSSDKSDARACAHIDNLQEPWSAQSTSLPSDAELMAYMSASRSPGEATQRAVPQHMVKTSDSDITAVRHAIVAQDTGQSTQTVLDDAENDDHTALNQHSHDSGSSPVLLSERIVKRVRNEKNSPRPSASSPWPRERLKQESDFTIVFPTHDRPGENSDLDELSGEVDTPRKRQRMAILARSGKLRQPRMSKEVKQGRCSSAPLDGHLSDNEARTTLTSTRSFLALQPTPPQRPDISTASITTIQQKRGSSRPSPQPAALQLRDVNELMPRKTDAVKDSKGRRAAKSGSGIARLSEDGDITPWRVETTLVTPAKASAIAKRTQDLLGTPSARKGVLGMEAAIDGRQGRMIQPQKSSAKSGVAPYHEIPAAPQPEDVIHQLDAQPEAEPLRGRPVATLSLSDFKINAKLAQGGNYAFTDVVRGREQRQCLPGCTREECCGAKFRRVIQIGGAMPTQPPRRLWDLSGASDEQRELEDYLGDNRCRLSGLGPQDRVKLLSEARAHQLAQRYGRHRQAFERAKTPPGFWRTDMPSTQETAEDIARARKDEEQLVRERHAEALRGGGRWIFTDE